MLIRTDIFLRDVVNVLTYIFQRLSIVEAYLIHGLFSRIRKLSFKYKLRMKVVGDSDIALDDFRFISRKSGEDITEEFSM